MPLMARPMKKSGLKYSERPRVGEGAISRFEMARIRKLIKMKILFGAKLSK